MKKILAVLACVAVCCAMLALVGCGQKPLEVTIGDATIELEAGFKEMKLTQDDIDSNTTHVYKKEGASYKVEIHSFDNPDGLTAEELCRQQGKTRHGCVESKTTPDGKAPAWLVSFAYNEGEDYHALIKEYFLNDGDEVVSLAYCFYAQKAKLGDTGFSMWIPECYNEATIEQSDALNAEALKYTVDESYCLADFMVASAWKGEYDYAAAVKCCEAIGVEPACDQAEFDAIGQEGWNIDSYFKSLEAICGTAVTDRGSRVLDDGTRVELICIEGTVDDVPYTYIYVGFEAYDGTGLSMIVSGPTETWPGIGEALAYSVRYDG